MYDYAPIGPLCPLHHPVKCMGYEGQDTSDKDYMMGEDCDSDGDSNGEDERLPCTFMCCRRCLNGHICGDDPSQYC